MSELNKKIEELLALPYNPEIHDMYVDFFGDNTGQSGHVVKKKLNSETLASLGL